jgi:hypothetical protein
MHAWRKARFYALPLELGLVLIFLELSIYILPPDVWRT